MADTSLLVNKCPELSRIHQQGLVLLVVAGSLPTNLAAGSIAKQRLQSLTMGD
jgi:hypothetical protein